MNLGDVVIAVTGCMVVVTGGTNVYTSVSIVFAVVTTGVTALVGFIT